jgi:hypothetical protein
VRDSTTKPGIAGKQDSALTLTVNRKHCNVTVKTGDLIFPNKAVIVTSETTTMTTQLSLLALLASSLSLSTSSLPTQDLDVQGLLQTHILFRHGDRTPCSVYPTDPYSDRSQWPVGFGELTAAGKLMHYQLGQWFRARYKGLLGPDYSELEVEVWSTDVDRTIMSAQSNLAGLFPPTARMQWLP